MKAHIEIHFGESICFIIAEYHEVQIVITTDCIHEKMFSYIEFLDNRILALATKIIRKTVDEKIMKASQLSWPSSVDELESKSREPPA